ncbi:pyridoxal-phosphate dependent enzyme [Zobellia galactanivorans]|uniref:1-aminocyclopropane-1-carboxylate deaminase/D-cysteine desulfhydrase n=1 Tax=Zobellia galactanivorans (strain DSM 12802 / CCUG 47099 / CIP 106680 / NCIMB 13871 / Dsij) TaxID=63186 RepID=UPI0026E2838E|nr:pyridoxal-phosphate dependent enzyme [Zobellia galactanivorans]MDO6810841.1 pyridoxal-phosphate dependent enzyme [Zobellia galactanivorans]
MGEVTKNQEINLAILAEKGVSLVLKREDRIHPLISGNKYRKLKYNLEEARTKGFGTLLTFGGAFSNHIAATAYAGQLHGFKTVGVIRGEEIAEKWRGNGTLKLAHSHGMEFNFISREAYRNKDSKALLAGLEQRFGKFYLLPEGGTNALAIKGCEEILTPDDAVFDVVCCAVGTGGTIAGISNAAHDSQKVLGFPALKGDFLQEDICKFAPRGNWKLITDYHFGGYAKLTEALVQFINDFNLKTQIPLDPVYTGKMVYGILDLVKNGYFPPKTKILAIHTGGLQGIAGMNQSLKKKNLPLINI